MLGRTPLTSLSYSPSQTWCDRLASETSGNGTCAGSASARPRRCSRSTCSRRPRWSSTATRCSAGRRSARTATALLANDAPIVAAQLDDLGLTVTRVGDVSLARRRGGRCRRSRAIGLDALPSADPRRRRRLHDRELRLHGQDARPGRDRRRARPDRRPRRPRAATSDRSPSATLRDAADRHRRQRRHHRVPRAVRLPVGGPGPRHRRRRRNSPAPGRPSTTPLAVRADGGTGRLRRHRRWCRSPPGSASSPGTDAITGAAGRRARHADHELHRHRHDAHLAPSTACSPTPTTASCSPRSRASSSGRSPPAPRSTVVDVVGTSPARRRSPSMQNADPGATPATAQAIAGNTLYFQYIGDDADVDLYDFSPSAGAQVGVRLSHLAGDGDLVLYGPPTDAAGTGPSAAGVALDPDRRPARSTTAARVATRARPRAPTGSVPTCPSSRARRWWVTPPPAASPTWRRRRPPARTSCR